MAVDLPESGWPNGALLLDGRAVKVVFTRRHRRSWSSITRPSPLRTVPGRQPGRVRQGLLAGRRRAGHRVRVRDVAQGPADRRSRHEQRVLRPVRSSPGSRFRAPPATRSSGRTAVTGGAPRASSRPKARPRRCHSRRASGGTVFGRMNPYLPGHVKRMAWSRRGNSPSRSRSSGSSLGGTSRGR